MSAPLGRRRVFGSLCLLVFLVNFGRVAFAPLVQPFMEAFHVREATAGTIVTLAWLGSAAPRMPTGFLLTRLSRHRVVLGVGGLLAIAATAITVSPAAVGDATLVVPVIGSVPADVAAVGAGAFFVGTASGVYFIAANPLVSELYPGAVGRALGIHGTASQLAAVAAPATVAALLVVADWRAVFVLLAVAAAVATAAFRFAAGTADIPTAGAADRDLFGAIRLQWRLVGFGVAVLGLSGFVWNAVFNFYVPYLTQVKELDDGTANVLLTLVFAAGVPAFLFTGRLADRVDHVRLLLAVLASFLTCVAALVVADGLPALLVVTVALGFAAHSLYPTMDAYLLSTLPDEHRGSAYAAYGGGMAAASAFGSVVLGTLVEAGVAYDSVLLVFAAGLCFLWVGAAVLARSGHLPGDIR